MSEVNGRSSGPIRVGGSITQPIEITCDCKIRRPSSHCDPSWSGAPIVACFAFSFFGARAPRLGAGARQKQRAPPAKNEWPPCRWGASLPISLPEVEVPRRKWRYRGSRPPRSIPIPSSRGAYRVSSERSRSVPREDAIARGLPRQSDARARCGVFGTIACGLP